IFLPHPPPNPVQLPPYLDHCVTSPNPFYHSHPHLVITISGIGQALPVTFETGYDPGCGRVMHTHDSSAIIHVETDQDVTYTLRHCEYILIEKRHSVLPTRRGKGKPDTHFAKLHSDISLIYS